MFMPNLLNHYYFTQVRFTKHTLLNTFFNRHSILVIRPHLVWPSLGMLSLQGLTPSWLFGARRSCFIIYLVQVILFEIDCAIFYTNLHEFFCQFISWTNWVNSGKFMDNYWISCQFMADIEKSYNNLIIINLPYFLI